MTTLLLLALIIACSLFFLPESKTNGGALVRRIMSLLLLAPVGIAFNSGYVTSLSDQHFDIFMFSAHLNVLIIVLYIGSFIEQKLKNA